MSRWLNGRVFTNIVINSVLIIYSIRTFTSESVLRAGFLGLQLCEGGSETDLLNPVQFFASTIHKEVAIIASATTEHPKAEYRRY
jgi:hypothetical protein